MFGALAAALLLISPSPWLTLPSQGIRPILDALESIEPTVLPMTGTQSTDTAGFATHYRFALRCDPPACFFDWVSSRFL